MKDKGILFCAGILLALLTLTSCGPPQFEMRWSDPSEVDAIPWDLQKATARFAFGNHQFKMFMSRIGCSAMVRGHERIVEGFRKIYDDPESVLVSLFSAGGANFCISIV